MGSCKESQHAPPTKHVGNPKISKEPVWAGAELDSWTFFFSSLTPPQEWRSCLSKTIHRKRTNYFSSGVCQGNHASYNLMTQTHVFIFHTCFTGEISLHLLSESQNRSERGNPLQKWGNLGASPRSLGLVSPIRRHPFYTCSDINPKCNFFFFAFSLNNCKLDKLFLISYQWGP